MGGGKRRGDGVMMFVVLWLRVLLAFCVVACITAD